MCTPCTASRRLFVVAAVVAAALVAGLPASAGARDEGFGNRGWITVAGSELPVQGIAVRPDGRIVVLSEGGRLQQRLLDGRFDRSFGSKRVTAGGTRGWLALQPDGKVVVASGASVVRYTRTGRRDTSFGVGGRVSIERGIAGEVAVAPDGDIALAVLADADGTAGSLLRLLPDGTPDAAFGVRGEAPLPAGSVPSSIAVQPDGKIVVGGRGVVARYRTDGLVDTAFAGLQLAGGTSTVLALAPDGRVAVAALRVIDGVGPVTDVVRLLPNGQRDESFGSGGVVSFENDGGLIEPKDIAALPDGSVVVAGEGRPTCPCKGADWFAVDIAPDGTLAHFAAPGAPDPEHDCWGGGATLVAAQPDGRLLFGGDMCYGDGGGWGGFVGRFNPDHALDAGPPLRARVSGVQVRSSRGTTRVTAVLRTSDAAAVTVQLRRSRGAAVRLLPGSALGSSSTRAPTSVEATLARGVPVRLVLLFEHQALDHYLLVGAADDRQRTVRLALGLPAR